MFERIRARAKSEKKAHSQPTYVWACVLAARINMDYMTNRNRQKTFSRQNIHNYAWVSLSLSCQ